MSLFNELKRRNVFRVTAAYVVVAWLVTEVGTTLLQTFGAPDWVAKAIILVFGLVFIPVVIFSWVYELTPEGIKKETQVNRDTSITSKTGRKLDLITIVAVVVGIAFISFYRVAIPPPVPDIAETTAHEASVAVLPFVNMSGNEENEYFSDGLTETLLHMLAQVPGLKVAARTSSFSFKEQPEVTASEIAKILNVAHILEGSVQRAGDRVRITAQLIRADDGFHVWSENYDRTLDNIFDIQDEIAEKVGGALSESLLGPADVVIVGVGTENLAAYESYLQALSHKWKFSFGGLREAETLLKDALSKDPDFLDAKIELADVFFLAQSTGLMSEDEAATQSIALLEQVLAKQPDNTRARALLVLHDIIRGQSGGNAAAAFDAIPLLEELVAEAPGEIQTRVRLANLLTFFGRADEGFEHYKKALEYDGLNAYVYYQFGSAYERDEQWEKSIEMLERSLELNPEQPNVLADIGRAKRGMGDAAGYIDGYIRAAEVDSQDHELPAEVAKYLYAFDLTEDGDEFLNRARSISPTSPATRMAEMVRSYVMGDMDRTTELAQSLIRDDVANRQGTYVAAISVLMDIGLRQGRAQQTYEYLTETVPGFNDAGSNSVPMKLVFAQGEAFALWYAVLPEDEALANVDEFLAAFQALNIGPEDLPQMYAEAHALRGDTEAAVELLLGTHLQRPVSDWEWWESYLSRKSLPEVVADPRVQEQILRLEREEVEARAALRAYLAARF